MKKIPMRRCVATLEMCEKKDLIRIVRTPEGNIVVDLTSKMNGRGAYLKRSKEALALAKKKNALGKALEHEIPDSIYEELEKLFMNKVLNYVGLASRGRFIAFGEDALLLAKPNQVIFLAKDASESTKDKVLFEAIKKKVPVIADFTKEELAHATGKIKWRFY